MARQAGALAHILNPEPRSGVATQYTHDTSQSVIAYEENGRWYHAYRRGKYPFPCDTAERNQYDLLHNLVHYVILKHRGPQVRDSKGRFRPGPELAQPMVASDPFNVLDIGCGSGIWACDIAARFPDAGVIGADIVGGQPHPAGLDLRWMTPDHGNPFDLEDDDWEFPRNAFDLIHASHLCGAVSDWPRFFAKVLRHLQPGKGQYEHFEIDYEPRSDNDLPVDPRLLHWWQSMQEALPNKPLTCPNVRQLLQQAGFTDIEQQTFDLPFYHNMNGQVQYGTILTAADSFQGLTMAPFTRYLGYTRDAVDQYVANLPLRHEHAIHKLNVWTARKPGPDDR